jgi:hypothetical protein
MMVDSARRVRGVSAVDDRTVADDELEVWIAAAIGAGLLNRRSRRVLRAEPGHVRIGGVFPAPESRAEALRLGAGVLGVVAATAVRTSDSVTSQGRGTRPFPCRGTPRAVRRDDPTETPRASGFGFGSHTPLPNLDARLLPHVGAHDRGRGSELAGHECGSWLGCVVPAAPPGEDTGAPRRGKPIQPAGSDHRRHRRDKRRVSRSVLGGYGASTGAVAAPVTVATSARRDRQKAASTTTDRTRKSPSGRSRQARSAASVTSAIARV